MKLWRLDQTGNVGWDEMSGLVVRAETENDARIYAGKAACDEDAKTWTDERYSTCVELLVDGEVGVVITDVLNG